MTEREFFRRTLGLREPWEIVHVRLDLAAKKVEVEVAVKKATKWAEDGELQPYQELESSGRLSLLRDTQLRSAIASNLNDYRSLRPVLAQPIGDYRRMLFETLPGRSFYDYRVGDGTSDRAVIIASIEAFRSDPQFEAAANAEITYGSDALIWIREFKRRTEEILLLLQTAK